MRVGIDARLNAYRGGGIAHYTEQLVAAMAPLLAAQGDELMVLQHARQRGILFPHVPHIRRATLFTPPHHRVEQWSLPIELLPLRLDVLHSPDFIAPLHYPCRHVITIHDLAFLHYPAILDDAARRYYGHIHHVAPLADAIIAVSEATRADICAHLNIPSERIDVVYEAAAPHFAPLTLPPGATRSLGEITHTLVAGTFGLFVSTIEPRKNIPTLLHALDVCRYWQPHTPYRLVVAGARGWHDEHIIKHIRQCEQEGFVAMVGNVTPDELRWLYAACRFYVNPSLYEGFGLPVVEAMACGAPTLVSRRGSLPEVAGTAAHTLHAFDVQAWARAIERVWHDVPLRAAMAHAGIAQAARFSWQRAAKETVAIYQRCHCQKSE